MKITIISPIFPHPRRGDYFGLERYVENLAVNLKKLGNDVRVITTFWNGGNKYDQYKGVEIFRIRELKALIGEIAVIGFLHYITFGLNLFRKKNYLLYNDSDVIILNIPLPFTSFFKIKNLRTFSVFHHYVPTNGMYEYLYFPVYHYLENKQFNKLKRVITVSGPSKMALMKHYRIEEKDIKVIPNGINGKKFNPSNRSMAIRDKFGNKIVLYAGLIIFRKRIPVLLKAMTYVIKQIPEVHLILTGRGTLLNYCKELSKKYKIHNNVTFLGFIDDKELLKYFASADIFVTPSELEGFGQVILEAMASGTPVICANKPPMADLIGNGGITFELNDPKDLAEKIIKLLTKQEELALLKENALKVVKEYDWLKIAKRYYEHIKK